MVEVWAAIPKCGPHSGTPVETRLDEREDAAVSDAPAYERLAVALRAAILDGGLTGRLPSQRALATRYGVTPDVARQAVEVLRGEGLVTTRQGSGTYVRVYERIVRASPGRLARDRWLAGTPIQDHDTGVRPRAVDVVVGEAPAPEWVAEALGVAPGSRSSAGPARSWSTGGRSSSPPRTCRWTSPAAPASPTPTPAPAACTPGWGSWATRRSASPSG